MEDDDTETARLQGRVEEIEAEVESLRLERDDIAQQREETEEAMNELLEEASADQEELWEIDSEENGELADTEQAEDSAEDASVVDEAVEQVREQLSFWKSRRKPKKETKKRQVALSDLAEAAQEAGGGEEEQLQAFRSMLGSMFGIKKPGDNLTDTPEPIEERSAAESVDDSEGHSIEEPVLIQEPSWARHVTPSGPEVDRSSARQEEQKAQNHSDDRHAKNRDLARRMAMTSLREVANQSARNALAEHTQRKLKRKMWIDGSLACISMGLGGAFLSQNFEQQMSWKTYGGVAVVIGVIAIVEMFRTFIRWQRATSMRKSGARRTRRPEFEDRYDRHIHDSQSSPKSPWPPHSQHPHQSATEDNEQTEVETSTAVGLHG